MTKSDLLRVQDVRDAYRLIGECRDLGSEPTLWHQRMFEGVCRLIGAPAASGGQGRWLRPQRPIEATVPFGAGFDSWQREIYRSYMRDLTPGADPVFRALQQLPGRLVTRTRRQLISDSTWYRSLAWHGYHRPSKIDNRLVSVYQVSDFSPREQRLLRFSHAELGPLIGRSLVSAMEPNLDTLSPRLRQTLACLLEGDSEKQVAARLGLSPATTHQYVTALYRHFGVRSRAQLLAHILRRMRGGGATSPA
jgi:DNA-binding CsgD family transcriptional regulator